MKRIVKETLKNGEIQYRVETNRMFFGLIPCEWYTCLTWYVTAKYCEYVPCDAIFNTLREAQIFCGIDPNSVVHTEIIAK